MTALLAALTPAALALATLVSLGMVAEGCSTQQSTSTKPAPSSATATTAASHRIDLAGKWKYLPYNGEGNMAAEALDDATWPTMHLPSNWYLLGRKEYPAKATAHQPSFGNSAPGELWPIDPELGLDHSGTVWFRRVVEWDGEGKLPAILDLDMVDYYAEIFVNGVSVGKHEGYFQRFTVDASKALRKGKNVVSIKVSAPALVFDMAQQYPVSFPKMQNQIKGIFGYHDTRPGATSWRGQERSTGGVLSGVALRESSGVDLKELTVMPLDVSDASARLVVEATVQNWTGHDVTTTVRGEIAPKSFSGDTKIPVSFEVVAKPGLTTAHTDVKIDRPTLWWSWDYGTPNLYSLKADLTGDANAVLDTRAATFGVRSITHDENWVFRLNGKRIYPRGSNYIATQWLSQADRAFYQRDAKLMIGANLNSIRVHAHLERQEMYDVADELGLMVWQDFPLQWGYTDLPEFHAEALRQAEDMVRQYKNHPSIILWSMHNESPHAMTWMKRKDKDQNLALDKALVELAARLDPSRIAHRDSGTGDGHYYYGWYDGKAGDLATLSPVQPLVTEYGAAALPNVETLKTMFDAKTLWPTTPQDWEAWQFADFQPSNTFKMAQVKQGKDIQEFVDNSQRYQAALVRYQTEVFRRKKWNGNTGIYQFMFVEDWPSITWAVVDYYRRPKFGYASLRDSMQRLLPSIEYDVHDATKPITLHIVNDYEQAFDKARISWKIVDAKGAHAEESRVVDIAPDSAAKVVELGVIPALASGAHLVVTVEDATSKVLGTSEIGPDAFLVPPPPPPPPPPPAKAN